MVLLARTLCLQCTACSSRCRHSFLPRTSPISTQQKEGKHLTNASQHGIWRCQGQSLYVLHRVRRLLETSVLWADSVWQCSGPCISMCSVSRSSVSPGRGYRATRAIEFAVRLRRLLAGSYVSLGLSFSSSLSDFHISDTARYVHIAEKQTASSPRSRPSTRLPSLRGCVVGGRLANSEIRPNRAIRMEQLVWRPKGDSGEKDQLSALEGHFSNLGIQCLLPRRLGRFENSARSHCDLCKGLLFL